MKRSEKGTKNLFKNSIYLKISRVSDFIFDLKVHRLV
jgi:hypothetical protein